MMTEDEYQTALAHVERLMRPDPEPGTPAGQALMQLVTQLQAYEAKHFPIAPPTAAEAAAFRAEQELAGLFTQRGYAMTHTLNAIGYTTLAEWERAVPANTAYYTPRPQLPVYLTSTSQMQNGAPATMRTVLRVQRLDAEGNLHYWQLHLSTLPTFDGASPMFDQDRGILDSGETAYQVVKTWLNEHGFANIVSGQVAVRKDLVLLDGHTGLLRFIKDHGWQASLPGSTP